MPATRRSAAGARNSLLNHFQATKRGSQSAVERNKKSLAGKSNQQGVEAARNAGTSEEESQAPSRLTALAGPNLPDKTDSSGRFVTPEPYASQQRPSDTRESSDSVQLLHAEHKSPVSVRQDPDKKKLFLLISPRARIASGSGTNGTSLDHLRSQPSDAGQDFVASLQRSPTADRTPVRETPPALREPPQAPRKRRLSQLSYQTFHETYEDSPLPTDKQRPSYKAFGASQEGGLSLTEALQTSAGGHARVSLAEHDAAAAAHHRTPSRPTPRDLGRTARREDEDDGDGDLVITPRTVRQRPTGHPLTPFATPSQAATFKDPFRGPRPKPTLSAGIFSYACASPAAKPKGIHPRHPRAIVGGEEDNPFIDAEAAQAATAQSASDSASIQELSKSFPSARYNVSLSLPLPAHYQTLMVLHTAIEQALVVQLATVGVGSSSVTSTDINEGAASIIRLPNLIAFAALRPLVERSAERRLGSVELARLLYIWTHGSAPSTQLTAGKDAPLLPPPTHSPRTSESPALSGLGFVLGRQRTLDASGRRKWDWSLGIELTVSRGRRAATPPLQVSFGSGDSEVTTNSLPRTPQMKSSGDGVFGLQTPPCTPPSAKRRREMGDDGSPRSPAKYGERTGRDGMSFVALWNNGIEERKNEVGRRLRALCAAEMERWLGRKDGEDDASLQQMLRRRRAQTPEAGRSDVAVGAGGLITPSATREQGRQPGAKIVRYDAAALAEGAEHGLIKVREEEEEEEDWCLPGPGEELSSWPSGFELKSCAPVPCVLLPSLKDATESALRHRDGNDKLSSSSSLPQRVSHQDIGVDAQPNPGPLSLMERIRAKEAQQKASVAERHPGVANHETREGALASYKRRSTLSRLNDVASNLYLLFTSSPAFGAENRRGNRLPVLALSDVLASMTKSSKVALSGVEARGALDLLSELCPGFVHVEGMGAQEWVRLCGGGQGLNEVRHRVREELQATL
ncbi:unnamed protein product [Parajaminaea phylloscopi]